MRAMIKKYACAYAIEMQAAMEYRMDFLVGLLSGSFAVIVQFYLWTAIYAGSAETELYGYNYGQMAAYVIMAGIMAKITYTGFEEEIMIDIMEGNLNRFFVQPIGHMPYIISRFFGKKTVQMSMLIIISAGLMWVLSVTTGARFEIKNIALALLVSPLCMLINCILFYCISAVNFWLTWAWGIYDGVRVISVILGGGMFPLDVFGDKMMYVLNFLPFAYVIYFPLKIVTGGVLGRDILYGVTVQIIWILILLLLSKIFWRAGMKKYIAARG